MATDGVSRVGIASPSLAVADLAAPSGGRNPRARSGTRRSVLGRTATALVITIGSYHHYRQIGTALFDLRQQLQPVHARHVDVRKDGDQFGLDFSGEAFQSFVTRGGVMQDIGALTGLTAEALPK